MGSYSYKYKKRFYDTLNIDSKTRKLLRIYHELKDKSLKGEIIYFIMEDNKDEIIKY